MMETAMSIEDTDFDMTVTFLVKLFASERVHN
jgi:hypothetical protein